MQEFSAIGKLRGRGYNRPQVSSTDTPPIPMSQSANPLPTAGMSAQDSTERQKFESEVRRIVEAGSSAGLMLRLLGSLAFQFHCPHLGGLQAKLGRAYTDIDFAGYTRQAKAISGLLAELGYHEDREIFVVTEGGRAIFENSANQLHVDVFYDKLDFCHHPLGWPPGGG